MIELKDLSFSYGEKPLFSGLSLSFAPGTLYGIVGPNGCGKTTLVRLLCGLEQPTSGAILLEGKAYGDYGRKALAQRISLMPQSRDLPPISGEELVSRGRYPYLGLSRKLRESDREAVSRALRRAGAETLAHRDVTRLSGGERQRLCLALLLAQDTSYVLLDEPTTYLDIAHRFSLAEQMRILREEGKCVIAVLHDLSLALRYCDRVLVLHQGAPRAFDSPEALISSGIAEEVFSVRCVPVQAEGERDVIFLPKGREER